MMTSIHEMMHERNSDEKGEMHNVAYSTTTSLTELRTSAVPVFLILTAVALLYKIIYEGRSESS